MKILKNVLSLFALAVLSITLSSCENTVVNNNTPTNPPDNFILPVWDYSDSHYFVDTLYKRCFNEFYNDSLTNYSYQNRINDANHSFEVWVQCNVTQSQKRICVGKVMLGPRPPQGYDTSITNPGIVLGDKFSGYFRRLEENEYYYSTLAGFIGLKNNIPDNYYIGVVYNNNSNQYYGKGAYESNSNDTLILKLVKVDTPDPETTPVAWKLKMKNVYKIPFTNLQTSTTVKTMFNENNVYRDTITGYAIPLITMLKLDKFNNTTFLPPPDGKFDWLTGKTIFPSEGYLVFPTLEPFGRDLPLMPNDSDYCFYEIYSQKKINVQMSYKAVYYAIKGHAVY